MKATAKTATNVKPMSGGEAIDILAVGEYVYGDYSSQRTDIINVTKIYNSNGTIRRTLPSLCKVYIGSNLTVTNETEPTTPTDPDPNPEPEPTPVFPESFILTEPSGAKAEYVFVRVIE